MRQQLEEEEESCFEIFAQQELVWAKVTGYPWQPGIISELPCMANPKYRVNFLGHPTHAYLVNSKLEKYTPSREQFQSQKNGGKSLRLAIQRAQEILSMKISTEEPCRDSTAQVEAFPLEQIQLFKSNFTQPKKQLPLEPETLLKKYKLDYVLPSPPKHPPPKLKRIQKADRHKESSRIIRKPNKGVQAKQCIMEVSLARKINKLLVEKQVATQLRHIISQTLSLQILGQLGYSNRSLVALRLLRWLSMSLRETVQRFYGTWVEMEVEKEEREKSSLNTNYLDV